MSAYLLSIGSVGCFIFFVIAIRKATLYQERAVMTVEDPADPIRRVIFKSKDYYLRKSNRWGWMSVVSITAALAMAFLLSYLTLGPPAIERQLPNQLGM